MKIKARKLSNKQIVVDTYRKQSSGIIEHSAVHPAYLNDAELTGEPEQLVGWPSVWMQRASLPDGNQVWVGVE